MVHSFYRFQFVLSILLQSATQCAKITFRLHLRIFGSIKGKNGTRNVSKKRTGVQSEELFHIRTLELLGYNSKILGQ